MTTPIWDKVVYTLLVSIWNALRPGLVLTLFTDNLGIHRDLQSIQKLKRGSIYLIFLPPNTSHYTQPLDDLIFAIYKTLLHEIGHKIASSASTLGFKWENAEIITAASVLAEQYALSSDKVSTAFQNAFLWPWNPDALLAAAHLNVGIPNEPSIEMNLTNLAEKVMAKKISDSKKLLAEVKSKTKRVTITAKYLTGFDTDSNITTANIEKDIKDEKARVKAEKTRLAEEKRAEKAVKKIARDEFLAIHKCHSDGCNSAWKDDKLAGWMFCDHCEEWAICKRHWNEENNEGKKIMAEHENQCKLARKNRRKRGRSH
jgi:hypothetical protein